MRYVLFILCAISFASLQAANFYWVGGSGEWDDVGNWATTSGGTTIHFAIPSANDDVFIDANSFTGPNQGIDLKDDDVQCRNLIITTMAPNARFFGTGTNFANGELSIYGDLVIGGSIVWDYAAPVVLFGSIGNVSIETNGRNFKSDLTIDGAATDVFNIVGDLDVNRDFNIERGRVNFAAGSVVSFRTGDFEGNGLVDYTGVTLDVRDQLDVTMEPANQAQLTTCRLLLGESFTPELTIRGIAAPRFQALIWTQTGDRRLNIAGRTAGGVTTTLIAADSMIFNGDARITENLRAGYLEIGGGSRIELDGVPDIFVENEFVSAASCAAPTTIAANPRTDINAPALATITVTGTFVENLPASGGATFVGVESGGAGLLGDWVFPAGSSARYWVGNTGDWDDSNHWSLTSGGVPGACPPLASNDAIFDQNSFSGGGFTVTLPSGDFSCADLVWTANDDDATFYQEDGAALSVYGNLYLNPQLIWTTETGVADLFLRGGGTNKEVRSYGLTEELNYTFDGHNGSWILLDSLATNHQIVLGDGELNSNDQPVSTGSILLENTRFDLDLTTSTVYVKTFPTGPQADQLKIILRPRTGGGRFDVSQASIVNDNVNGMLEVDLDNTVAPWNRLRSFVSNGDVFFNDINNYQGEILDLREDATLNLDGTVTNVTFFRGKTYLLGGTNNTILNLTTFTADGNCSEQITIRGNGVLYRLFSTQDQFASYLQLENIAASGSTWQAGSSIDLGGVSGWDFVSVALPRTLYWVGDSGDWFDEAHWSLTSGGFGGECIPTQIDDVIVDANSFSLDGEHINFAPLGSLSAAFCHTIDTRGLDDDMVFQQGNFEFYGSAYFSDRASFDNSLTLSRVDQLEYLGTDPDELLAEPDLMPSIFMSGTGTLTLLSDLRSNLLWCSAGTFVTNDFDMELEEFFHLASNFDLLDVVTVDIGSSVITIAGSGFPFLQTENSNARLLSNNGEIVNIGDGDFFINSFLTNLNLHFDSVDVDRQLIIQEATLEPSAAGPLFNRVSVKTGNMYFNGGFETDSLVLEQDGTYSFKPMNLVTVKDRLIAIGTACAPIEMQSINADNATIFMGAGAETEMDYVRLERLDATGPGQRLAGKNSANINNSSSGWTFDSNVRVFSLDRDFLGPDLELCDDNIPLLEANLPTGFVGEYRWQDGSTQPSFQPDAAGTFFLNVRFDVGTPNECELTDTIVVTTGDLTLLPDTLIQSCGDTYLLTVPDVTAPGYTWSVTSGTVVSQTATTITVNVPATVELSQTIDPCTGTTVYTIVEGTIPPVDTTVTLNRGESFTTDQMTYTPTMTETVQERYDGASGCDSLRNITFIIEDLEGPPIFDTLCAPGEYVTDQMTYFVSQDTVINEMYITATNADSAQTYNVTVLPPNRTDVAVACLDVDTYVTEMAAYTINRDTVFEETYPGANGCDSIVTYTITTAGEGTPIADERCGSGEYVTNLRTYFITQDTTIEESYPLVNGCDSIQVYTVTLLDPAMGTTTEVFCGITEYITEQETYTITQDTIFEERYMTVAGCDSIQTYNVTINDPATGTTTEVFCGTTEYITEQETYTITQDTIFEEMYMTAAGCDSIQTYNVTINDPATGTTTEVFCGTTEYTTDQEMYTITQDTTFEERYMTVAGCDSIQTYNVTINDPATGTTTEVFCGTTEYITEQETYTITQDTIFEEMYMTAAGCDSIQTYNVTINDPATGTTTEVFCGTTEYITDQETYTVTQDTTFEELYMTVAGCDSIQTYNVTINDPATGTTTEVFCGTTEFTTDQDTYTITQDTTFEELYMTVAGCDSIQTYNVTINDPATGTTTEVFCGTTVYVTDQETYTITQDTTFEERYMTVAGCDSIQTYNVTINDPATGTTTEVFCGTTEYTTDQEMYTITQDTTFEERYLTVAGCDSIQTYNVTINDPATGTTTEVFCGTTEYITDQETYTITQDTTFEERYMTTVGCDSIQIYNVTINDPATGTTTEVFCGTTEYITDQETYIITQDTTFEESYLTVAGCDSIQTYNVTINDPATGTTTEVFCGTTVYVTDQETYTITQDTTFEERYMTVAGCDSIQTYNVTINDPGTGTTTEVFCGTTEYVTDQETYIITQDTTFEELYMTVAGCDSIQTFNVTINDPATGTTTEVFCGTTEYITDQETYTITQDTTFEELYMTADGCDSIQTYNVTINDPATGTTTEIFCGTTEYTTDQEMYTITQDTTFEERYMTVAGCDSIQTYNITINDPATGTTTEVFCGITEYITQQETYTITQDTTFEELYMTVAGCDSIQTYNVTINDPAMGTTTEVFCGTTEYITDQETYTITQDTTFEESYLTVAGCDSIQTYNVTINDPATGTTTEVFCGTTEYITDQETYTITQDTTFEESYLTVAGCDSIQTYNVTINDPATGTTTEVFCGTTEYITDQETYIITQDTTFEELYMTVAGCDSIQTYNVTINDPVTGTTSETFCGTTEYVTDQETYTITQDTTFEERYMTVAGCDSVQTFNVTINDPATGTTTEVFCGTTEYVTNQETYTITQDTTFEELYLTVAGCDSIQTYNITINPNREVSASVDRCGAGEFITGQRTYFVTQDTTIEELYSTSLGCDSVQTFLVSVLENRTTNSVRSICGAGSFVTEMANYFITQDTTFSEVYPAANGCDSTVNYDIAVSDELAATTTELFCAPTLFTTDQSDYFVTQDTIIEEVYDLPGTCDSAHTYVITVAEPTSNSIPRSQCGPGEQTVGLTTYFVTQDTTILELRTNAAGCDSTISYVIDVLQGSDDTLTINPFTDDVLVTEIATYPINGDTTITERLTGANGCDSIQTYVLVRPAAVTTTGFVERCGPGTITTGAADYFVTADTTIRERFLSSENGDSLRITEVTILEDASGASDHLLCSAGSFTTDLEAYFVTQDTTITEVYPAANGCDSIHIFTVNVSPVIREETAVQRCGASNFVTDLATYFVTQDTVITEVYPAANGCDSTHVYTLTIEDVIRTNSSAQYCAPTAITTDQNTYFVTQDTVIEEGYVSTAGCDSIHTLTVTIDAPVAGLEISEASCGPTTFVTDQADYFVTQDTLIEERYVAANGCDSIQTYRVTIAAPPPPRMTAASVCRGSEYTTLQATYVINRDTVIEETFPTTGPCDRINIYTITLAEPVADTSLLERCGPGEIVTDLASYFVTRDTTFEEAYRTADGCDSVHTYVVTILESTSTTVTLNPFAADELVTDLTTYTINGDTTILENYPAANGCDSIVTYVIVRPNSSVTTGMVNRCGPGTINTGAADYFVTQDTIIREQFTNQDGGDSLRITEVTVLAEASGSSSTTLCAPGVFTTDLDEYFVTQDTLIEEIYLAANGCDSFHLFTVKLEVVQEGFIAATICRGSEYTTDQMAYRVFSDTTIVEVYPTGGACDSTHRYVITVEEAGFGRTDLNFCGPTNFATEQRDYFIMQDTSFVETYAAGVCDSTHQYVVTVADILRTNLADEFCGSTSITTDQNTYFVTRDTVIEEAYVSTAGCDSLVTFSVKIKQPVATSETVELCGAQTYSTAQSDYFVTQDTTIRETYIAANGCDSVRTFFVEVGAVAGAMSVGEICGPANFTTGQNTYFVTRDTMIRESINRPGQCDSIHTYTVLVREPILTTSDVELCEPTAFTTDQRTYFITQDTAFSERYVTASVCDSVHTYTVSVGEIVPDTSRITLCSAGPFVTEAGTYQITGDTTFTERYPRPGTCDSAQYYVITVVDEIPVTTSTRQFCGPATVTIDGEDIVIFADTTVERTYVASNGCDSVHQTNVVIYAPVEVTLPDSVLVVNDGTTVEATVNGGTQPFRHAWTASGGGITFSCTNCPDPTVQITEAVTVTTEVTDINNCSDAASTRLVRPAPVFSDTLVNFCGAGSLTTERMTYNIDRDTVVTEVYNSAIGGDSIRRITFNVIELEDFVRNIEVNPRNCSTGRLGSIRIAGRASIRVTLGDRNGRGNSTFSDLQNGTYSLRIEYGAGCVYTEELEVGLIGEITTDRSFQLCEAGDVRTTQGTYSVSADTTFSERYVRPGTCDSVVNYTVNVGAASQLDAIIQTGDVTCSGERDGFIFVSDPDRFQRLRVNGRTITEPTEINDLGPGQYVVDVLYGDGCSFSRVYTIKQPPPFEVNLPFNPPVALGDRLTLTTRITGGRAPFTYRFTAADPTAIIGCLACPELEVEPTEDLLVRVFVVDDRGCLATDTTIVQIIERRRLYLPTAFSPNGDGTNDRLTVYSKEGSGTVESLRVYDRWGTKAFENGGFPLNDEDGGWDGGDFNSATYVVRYRVRWDNGTVEHGAGEVHLMR
ncbi:gliding motility-associated C-terminal domain-containing protein [Lewinella sp. 4G2]|uniref:T9SS type B sorting domain-containing protein n=1 Tax=Lewinella sp. 4G2 TaxID=1803372 RepID=UPI0007DFD5C5|nr:gliding motility-associated C-terminal domain-containing protein [Lewinella sp. 4G2]OAV46290.1 hypothetical protein A3850_018725 [Lewinella sp. 4G2]